MLASTMSASSRTTIVSTTFMADRTLRGAALQFRPAWPAPELSLVICTRNRARSASDAAWRRSRDVRELAAVGGGRRRQRVHGRDASRRRETRATGSPCRCGSIEEPVRGRLPRAQPRVALCLGRDRRLHRRRLLPGVRLRRSHTRAASTRVPTSATSAARCSPTTRRRPRHDRRRAGAGSRSSRRASSCRA